MGRCFVTRRLPGTALDRLAAAHEVEVWPLRLPPGPGELGSCLAGADGLLSLLTDPIGADVLERAPGLRAIANYAVGVDNVDVAEATRRGIPVGNTPDVLTETSADFAFALLMAAARRVVEADAAARRDWVTWEPAALLGVDIHGATLGIVGHGRIGSAVARRAEGFGMRVLHSERSAGEPLDELLATSDFVTLHCPLTAETTGLIGARELGLMRPGAVLVNTARGPIVDGDALARALSEGEIAAAALDVTDPEPPPPGHPLLSAPNLLLTPHIASASERTRAAMADIAVDNLLAALAGEPMAHCVNPEVYE